MTKLLAILFVAVCFLGVSAKASEQQVSKEDALKIQQAVQAGMPISKGEIESSIDNLVKQGVISADQAAEARKELQGMSASDIQALKEQAAKMVQ